MIIDFIMRIERDGMGFGNGFIGRIPALLYAEAQLVT